MLGRRLRIVLLRQAERMAEERPVYYCCVSITRIYPTQRLDDRSCPSRTEENAWLVGKSVAEQLYEEWRPSWKQMYQDISSFDADKT
jgi:hypothetical protein